MGQASDLFGEPSIQQQAVSPPEIPKASSALSLYSTPEAQNEDKLKFIADETVDESPDRAARSVKIMRRTGIPKKFIDDNFDELDKAARQADFDSRKFMQESPKVADWMLKNPDYAALLREDQDSMVAMEKILTQEAMARQWGEAKSPQGQKPSVSSVLSGLWTAGIVEPIERMRAGTKLMYSDLIGSEGMRASASKEYEQSMFRDIVSEPRFDSTAGRWIYSGAVNTVRMAPALAAGIITKNPNVTLAVMGAQMEPETYAKYRTRGGTVGEALLGSTAETGIEIATELLPMKFIVDNLGKAGMGGFLRGVLGREIPTELVAQISQDAIDTAIANPDQSWKDFVANLPESIGQTITATLMMAGTLSIPHAALRYAAARERGTMNENFFKALGDVSEDSKLRSRLPDAYQQIVGDLTKDGPVENVYTPIEFFQSHFQERGIDPQKVAADLGLERQYKEAVNTGGKIAIPTNVYANHIAPTEHNAAFAREMSFAPDQMSARETDEFLKKAEEQAPQEQAGFQQSVETAMAPIREQLKAIYPTDIAEKNATIIEARLRTRAERLGIDPLELMRQRPVSITEDGGTEGTLYQTKVPSYTEQKGGENEPGRQQAVRPGEVVHRNVKGTPAAEGWAGATRARGADGSPSRIYRGGQRSVGEGHFAKEALGAKTKHPSSGLGVWFTTRSSDAKQYGPVSEYHLDVRNPKVIPIEDLPAFDSPKDAAAFRESLRKQGHDGIALDARHVGGPIHWIAFAPEQVIIPEQGGTLFQSSPMWFSALSRGIESAKQTKATAKDWKAIIKKMEGVKSDEVDAIGLNEWLDMQKGQVTKEALLEFVRQNGVQVQEVEKGKVRDADVERLSRTMRTMEIHTDTLMNKMYEQESIKALDQVTRANLNWWALEAEQNIPSAQKKIDALNLPEEAKTAIVEYGRSRAELARLEGQRAEEKLARTKFASYQLPGGENYRELLLTLPEKQAPDRNAEQTLADMGYGIGEEEDGSTFLHKDNRPLMDNEYTPELRALLGKAGVAEPERRTESFRSSHFDEQNILSHVRFNERVDSENKRVLFIEEVQSDFGQSFRKQKDAINTAVDNDFNGIIDRMKADGVLEVECD